MPLKVLLLEDDKNLSSVLEKLLAARGLNITLTHSAARAEYMASIQAYDLMLMDLILPKVTGLDLVKRLMSRGLINEHSTLWLMSGIFPQASLPKTIKNRKNHFFQKPLNKDRLNGQLNKWLSPHPNPLTAHEQIFYMPGPDIHKGKVPDFDPGEKLQSHQLMFVYFALSLCRFTGSLHIHYEPAQTISLIYQSGWLVDLKMKDKPSYLGEIFIQDGLISRQDLNQTLKTKGSGTLGEKLIADCLISPHFIDKGLKKQMQLRLMKTMDHRTVTIRLAGESSPASLSFNRQTNPLALCAGDLLNLTDEWVKQTNPSWLKSLFEKASEMTLVPLHSPFTRELKTLRSPFLNTDLSGMEGKKLKTLLAENSHNSFYLRLYTQLLLRSCGLQHHSQRQPLKEDHNMIRHRLKAFLSNMERQDHFEWLNIPFDAKTAEVEASYKKIIKLFHIDSLAGKKNLPADVIELYNKCFSNISHAYKTLTDPSNRDRYIHQIKTGGNEDVVSIYKDYGKAKEALEKDQFETAHTLFKSILEYKKAPKDTLPFYIWAQLKMEENKPLTKDEQNKILQKFDSVPLDSQDNYVFRMARGLFMKKTGHRKEAYSWLTEAIRGGPPKVFATKIRQERFALKQKRKKNLFGFLKKSA